MRRKIRANRAKKRHKIDILIIDDGSDLTAKSALQNLDAKILTRESNGGKGAAVKDGFSFALANGYTHAFQIDADAQHDLGEIAAFLAESKAHPNAIICANPRFSNAPKSRLYGRKITQFWIALNSLGRAKIKDAMTGFRIYPLNPRYLFPKTNAMDFDVEILLRAHFEGFEMRWLDVGVKYDLSNPSHFRAFKDNARFVKLHFRYFCRIPKHVLAHRAGKKWHERDEAAGKFWLKTTILCVKFLPRFALNFVALCVTFIYFLLFKNERKNIEIFYQNARNFCEQNHKDSARFQKPNAYLNFFYFGLAICDKVAAWLGKITHENLELNSEEISALESGRGQILIMSHFGNIEVARALSSRYKRLKIITFVYQKNTEKFLQMIDEISGKKIARIYVDEIDFGKILELQKIVENGAHIGIMGDRVALNDKRNVSVDFLGKPCIFPCGAFLIAGILGAEISLMWCERKVPKSLWHAIFEAPKYKVEVRNLGNAAFSSKNKLENIAPLVKNYAHELESHALNNPTQWFTFYDFWDISKEAK